MAYDLNLHCSSCFYSHNDVLRHCLPKVPFYGTVGTDVLIFEVSKYNTCMSYFNRIGRDDVIAHSNMRPPFSEVKTSPGNRYLP